MPLCIEEFAEIGESEVLTGVGPGQPPMNLCHAGCCGRPLRLQIRSRYGSGNANLCAAFIDGEGDPDTYFTEREAVTVYKAWDSDPNPDEVVRTCERTVSNYAGPAAVVTWGAGESAPDCGATETETEYSPEGCLETLLDPPADYSTTDPIVNTYSGDSATEADVQAAAISAFTWGEWSEWADLVIVDAYSGSFEGGYLDHYLAWSTRSEFSGPYGASVASFESELRVVGGSPLHLALASGEGPLEDIAITRSTISPGTPMSFGVSLPTWTEGWQTTDKVLRCVCPVKFAPAS